MSAEEAGTAAQGAAMAAQEAGAAAEGAAMAVGEAVSAAEGAAMAAEGAAMAAGEAVSAAEGAAMVAEGAAMVAEVAGTAAEGAAMAAEQAAAAAQELAAPAKETIVFAGLNWPSAQLQNAIARRIIEAGYGYPTDAIEGGTIPLQAGLLGGDIDVTMEVWLPNQQEFWGNALAEGAVIPVGKSLDDNWQSAFVVPTYLVEQNPGLQTVQDIRDHLDQFPQEGGKAVLWNCISTWACSGVNESQVAAYGLDDVITLQDPGSSASLFASLYAAYEKGEAWLGYLWGPTQPDAELDLTRLAEPACAAGQEPTEGCGYPVASIRIAVHPTLVPRAPDVIEFLRKWDFTAAVNVAADAYMAETGATSDEAATWFLKDQEAAWTQWVPADVAQRVKDSLG
jgi:glycine betaine/proline transport system substrate-binding protein